MVLNVSSVSSRFMLNINLVIKVNVSDLFLKIFALVSIDKLFLSWLDHFNPTGLICVSCIQFSVFVCISFYQNIKIYQKLQYDET